MNHKLSIKYLIFVLLIIIFSIYRNIYAKTEVRFETAFELFQNKLYFLAHKKFGEIIKTSASYTEIEKSYYYSALSSFYLKQYKRAISEFNRFLLNFPESIFKEQVKFYIALSYFNSEKYVSAIQHFRDFLKEFPDSKLKVESLFYIGKSYFNMDYIDKSLESLNKIIEEYPESELIPDIEFEIAKIYFYNKQYKEALKKFDKLLEKYPLFKNRYEIELWIAKSYKWLGEIDEALKHYRLVYNTSLISVYRKSALFNISLINFQLNNYIESKKYLLEFIEKYSDDINLLDDCYYFLARIFYINGEYSLSQKYLDLLIDRFKDSEWLENAYLLYGKILLDKKLYMKAIKILNKGAEIAEPKDLFLKIIADTYLKIYYYNDAKDTLLNLVKIASSSKILKEAYYNLGNIYLKENNKKKALKYFLNIYNQYPGDEIYTYSIFNIGKIYYEKKNYANALKYFKKLIELKINKDLKEEVNYYITKIYFKEKRYKESIKYLEKWFDKNIKKNRVELLWIKAESLYSIKDKLKAKTIFQKIVEEYPDTEYGLKSIERLIDYEDKKQQDYKFILRNLKTITKYHSLSETYSKKILKMLSEQKNE